MTKPNSDDTNMTPSQPRELGYGKPPKDKQFQKGRSGNPSGRPKSSLNLRATLERHLYRRMQVREGGKLKTMTVFDAMIMSMIAAGGRGNLKVIQMILGIVSKPPSLTELMAGKPVFSFTPEEAARFTNEKLVEGMEGLVDLDEQPVL